MRIEHIKAHDLGPFREVDLNLSDLGDAQIVAVVGENGSGKSTLLELATGGALYRECATRGSLARLATSREASLEVVVAGAGKRWRLAHRVDAVSGKGESVAVGDDGEGAVTGKVRDFDAWASLNLPAPEVLYASTVLTQRGRSFLELSASERKSVLLRVLGVERLEEMAATARTRARSVASSAEVTAARLADAQREGGVAEAADSVRAAADTLELSERRHAAERARLEAARVEAARVTGEAQRIRAAAARRTEVERELAGCERELADTESRARNNRAVLDRAVEIRAAVQRHCELGAELDRLNGIVTSGTSAVHVADREWQRAQFDARRVAEELRREEERAERLELALRDEAAVTRAASELPALRDLEAQWRAALATTEEALEGAMAERGAGADDRIEVLREGLNEVVERSKDPSRGVAPPAIVALDTLRADDKLCESASTLPARIASAATARDTARRELEALRERMAHANRLAALSGRIAEDSAALERARESARLLGAQTVRVRRAEADASAQVKDLRAALATTEGDMARLRAEDESLRAVWSLADKLAFAVSRLEELEPRIVALKETRGRLEAQLAGLRPEPEPLPINLDAVEALAERTGREVGDARLRLGLAEDALRRARDAAARSAALEGQLAPLRTEASDWALLGDDLGRDGLQAALVDAAGPELTELANELLHACVGSRWTVSIETLRLSADGKRQLEGCDVRVLDTERGRDTTAESLSGGESVLVGEAISLALSAMACRRAGVVRPTLVRDESGAALSPAKGEAYVAMLRRAATIVGADRVLLVSHSPEVQALADARIVIDDGKAVIG
jgi:DNA repair protein SbcC/Rad50